MEGTFLHTHYNAASGTPKPSGTCFFVLRGADCSRHLSRTARGAHRTTPSARSCDKVEEPLVEWARRPANRVRNKVEAYEEYLQRIPALKTRRISRSEERRVGKECRSRGS